MTNGKFDFSFEHPVSADDLLGGTGQLARAAWISKRLRNNDIYFMQDGHLSQLLFKEVLSCFLAGLDIATIVLAFSLLERTIAGRIAVATGNSPDGKTSEWLFQCALERHWLTIDEHKQLDELRKRRNPIIHFRDPLSNERPEVQAKLDRRTIEQVLEEDAKKTLEATIHVLLKTAI